MNALLIVALCAPALVNATTSPSTPGPMNRPVNGPVNKPPAPLVISPSLKPATSADAVNTAKPQTSHAILGLAPSSTKVETKTTATAPTVTRPYAFNVDIPASEVLKEAKAARLQAKHKSRISADSTGKSNNSEASTTSRKTRPAKVAKGKQHRSSKR